MIYFNAKLMIFAEKTCVSAEKLLCVSLLVYREGVGSGIGQRIVAFLSNRIKPNQPNSI